jgi:hypothetical protein
VSWDKSDGEVQLGQARWNRTARTGKPEKTARTGQPEKTVSIA